MVVRVKYAEIPLQQQRKVKHNTNCSLLTLREAQTKEISMWEQFLTVSMDGRMIYAHPASEYFPIREIVLRPWRNAMDVYGLELQRPSP